MLVQRWYSRHRASVKKPSSSVRDAEYIQQYMQHQRAAQSLTHQFEASAPASSIHLNFPPILESIRIYALVITEQCNSVLGSQQPSQPASAGGQASAPASSIHLNFPPILESIRIYALAITGQCTSVLGSQQPSQPASAGGEDMDWYPTSSAAAASTSSSTKKRPGGELASSAASKQPRDAGHADSSSARQDTGGQICRQTRVVAHRRMFTAFVLFSFCAQRGTRKPACFQCPVSPRLPTMIPSRRRSRSRR
jgi:hypothetical protein